MYQAAPEEKSRQEMENFIASLSKLSAFPHFPLHLEQRLEDAAT